MTMRSLPGADPVALRTDTSAEPSASPMAGAARGAAAAALSDETVVLLLVDVAPGSKAWGYARFVLGRWPLRHVAGLRFAKQLGSGFEGGFGLRPSATRQGLFLVFESLASAQAFVERSELVAAYRHRAREFCSVVLRAYASRGRWSGQQLAVAAEAPALGPIASLTRASIRPSRAVPFWRMAPAAQASLEQAPGCRLAVGVGEAPLLRQATFSVWDSAEAMDAYARSGAHLEAIRAAHGNGFFAESAFVRFVPLALSGQWKGRRYG